MNLHIKQIISNLVKINNKTYFYDKNKNNLLHLSVATGDLNTVYYIISNYPYIDLWQKNEDGHSPLGVAKYRNFDNIIPIIKDAQRVFFEKNKFRGSNTYHMYNINFENPGINLGFKNKKVLNILKKHSIVNGKFNAGLMNLIFTIKKIHKDIDEQLLLPLLNNIENLNLDNFYFEPTDLKDIVFLLKKQNPRRLINIILKEKEVAILILMCIMTYQDIVKFKPKILEFKNKEFKDLDDLRIILEGIKNKVTQKKYPLKGKVLSYIFNKDIDNTYKYIIPKKSQDLIDYGVSFKNCIGNGNYAKRINNNHHRIIIVFKNNKPYSCIELDSKYKIINIKGIANSSFNDLILINNINNIIENNRYLLFFDLF